MKKLKELRKLKNMTQQKVANYLNISQQAYAKYELDLAEPDLTTLTKLSKLFNCSVDYLMGITNEFEEQPKKKGIRIPVLDTIPAGIPIEAIEDVIDYEEISEEMASRGDFFALKVKGDSMLPTIRDGDIVIIRQQDDAESGKICVVMVNGYDATLKEIKKEPNGIWVLPHNPNCDFKPTFYSRQEVIELPVRIVGVAVEIRRGL